MKDSENSLNMCKGWQLIFFSSARGTVTVFVALMTFVSYVAAGGYGIAVAVAGTIATATRILDGITDPLMAFIGDRMVTRYGRVRLMLGIGITVKLLSLLTIFFWGIGTNVVVFTIAYIFYIIGNTIFIVGLDTGSVIITKDPKQRTKMGQYGVFFTTICAALLSFYNSSVLVPKYGGLTIEALQELCIVVLTGTVMLTIMSIIGISGKDVPENFKVGTTKIDVKAYLRVLKENVPLRCFIVSMASDQIAQQTASQSAISIMVFGIIIGNFSLRGSLSLIELIPTLLVVFFAARLGGKAGAKKNMVRWSWISMIISIVMVAYMAIIDTKQISVALLPTIGFLIIDIMYVASRAVVSAFTNAMRPDIVDYELYRSGSFMPGIISATISFCNKLVSSFSTTIVGFCLAGIGYVTAMPQPKDALTPTIFWMAMFLWMGMPFLGWLSTVIAMKFYKIDGEAMEEIQRVNEERRLKMKSTQ